MKRRSPEASHIGRHTPVSLARAWRLSGGRNERHDPRRLSPIEA